VFGPDAVARRDRRLHHLSLHSSYRRLLVSAAFQAAREVVGELVAAEVIDPRSIPFILLHAAAFSSNVTTLPPAPRPPGVPRAEMADIYRSADGTEWQVSVEEDAVKPTMEGHVVLAATALHERRYFRDEWIVEQYFGPDTGRAENGLATQLNRLPWVVVADGIDPAYDGLAPGAVVRPKPDVSGSVDFYTVTLCPRVAAKLGWRSDPRNVFTYLDDNDQVVARTLYWRDGGVPGRASDTTVFRHGYILVVREDRADDIRPYLATAQVSRAWRVTQKNGGHNREVTCGSRVEAAPGVTQPR
jgi:hypothetical protein